MSETREAELRAWEKRCADDLRRIADAIDVGRMRINVWRMNPVAHFAHRKPDGELYYPDLGPIEAYSTELEATFGGKFEPRADRPLDAVSENATT